MYNIFRLTFHYSNIFLRTYLNRLLLGIVWSYYYWLLFAVTITNELFA